MEQKTRRRHNPLRFYLVFAATIAMLAALHAYFHFEVPPYKTEQKIVATQEAILPKEEENLPEEEIIVDTPSTEQPEETSIPINLHRGSPVWSYQECFPDSQATQLSAAILNGISPTQSRDELALYLHRHQLVDISHSPFYAIDDLHHSMPYLVPKAQQLLNTIAINYLDTLRQKGLPLHRPIVSSVLRTAEDVQQLQHGNKNATTNSCHCYGTTIDITYHRFQPLENIHQTTRYDDDLKLALAEVLYDLRQQGRCYVKYESKQACFHLTVR
ncbi:MAG: DUF5715 family protein [Bacteroidaceae bacterium]|nr:DUF5715 family protein [Bacteroidaceae bacterium]